MKNWFKLLKNALKDNNELLNDIVSNTLSDTEMVRKFDSDYGGIRGCPFTVWTTNFVYFPLCSSGAEWVGSVARNPNGKPTEHQGGG